MAPRHFFSRVLIDFQFIAVIIFFISAKVVLAENKIASNVASSVASFSASDPVLNLNESSKIFTLTNQFQISLTPDLERRIDFWIKIYSFYSSEDGVIHDAKYPEIIFERVSLIDDHTAFKESPKERKKNQSRKIEAIKDFYQEALLSIHKKQQTLESLNDVEKRIYELYKNINEPNKFYQAASSKRIRLQVGQKDRFIQGLFYSGRYLTIMEKIFRDRGMPVELARLPFVESSFNLKARSKVGASGIWQFMRSTGKFYLRIDDTIDERNDPIRAAEAAAGLLRLNYESLGNWPLAVTAYNHGRKGLMRAVRKVGSESLSDIISNYKSRSFGFASSNFFSEFMAAVTVEKNAEKYFGKFERDKSIEFAEFIINDYVSIVDLATYTRIPLDVLHDLNPALSDLVFQEKKWIPVGYVLRIPPELKDDFLVHYNNIPASRKYSRQK